MYEGEYHGKAKHAKDLSSVLDRAFANGVERIIVTGGSLEESRQVHITKEKGAVARLR